jgi:hypothetical protein
VDPSTQRSHDTEAGIPDSASVPLPDYLLGWQVSNHRTSNTLDDSNDRQHSSPQIHSKHKILRHPHHLGR